MNAQLTITKRLREYAGFPLVGRGHRGRLIRAAMLDAAREIDRLVARAPTGQPLEHCGQCGLKRVPSRYL